MPRVAVSRSAAFLVLSCAFACAGSDPVPTADFSGPSGMALAGTSFNYVYVANSATDSLQVIRLGAALKEIDLLPAPARYYPLYIPAGANPTELAASFDGRYVFVLNAVGNTVRVVDADSQFLLRNGQAEVLTTVVGPRQAAGGAMVASPVACPATESGATCLGRVYVALAAAGQVAVVDLVQGANGVKTLATTSLMAVGGSPMRLAMHPTQDVIFATDAAAPELIRIDRSQNATRVSRVPIDYTGGPVAVSSDGTLVMVGRPVPRDVIVMDATSLLPLDANPLLTPVPRCLRDCDDATTDICSGAHPADQALCVGTFGLQRGLGPQYSAVYLGFIPAQITSVANPNAALLDAPCGDQNTTLFNQAMAIATMDGPVSLVGLRDQANQLNIKLIASQNCSGATLSYPTGQSQPFPEAYLDACPAAPARARFVCVNQTNPNDKTRGVTVLPGQAGGQTWTLNWEAVLPNMDMSGGGGSINDAGQLVVTGASLFFDPSAIQPRDSVSGTAAFPGDILEIVTNPLNVACSKRQVCGQRRIIAVVLADNQLTLTLDTPFEAGCYKDLNVGYRIRAGNSFMVTHINGAASSIPVRVRSGEQYGLGRFAGDGAVMFKLRGDLLEDQTSTLCDTYNDDGSVKSPSQSPLLSRKTPLLFTVNDNYAMVRKGLIPDATGRVTNPAGRIPGGILMTRSVASTPTPWLFVSYVGSDSVYISNPADSSQNGANDQMNKVLQ